MYLHVRALVLLAMGVLNLTFSSALRALALSIQCILFVLAAIGLDRRWFIDGIIVLSEVDTLFNEQRVVIPAAEMLTIVVIAYTIVNMFRFLVRR